ncbi:hypothetical protein H0H92_008217, partial [Tricholoma furcatifolium]
MALNLDEAKFLLDPIFNPYQPQSIILSYIPLPWHQLKTIGFELNSELGLQLFWTCLSRCRSLTRLDLLIAAKWNESAFAGVDLERSIDLPELHSINLDGEASHIFLPMRSWRNITRLSVDSTLANLGIQIEPEDLQRIFDLCCTYLEELTILDVACYDGQSFPLASSDAATLRELEFNGSPSNLLDATRAFGASLSSVEFCGSCDTYRPNMTPGWFDEVLSTLSTAAMFTDKT